MSKASYESPKHLADLLRRSVPVALWPSIALAVVTIPVAPWVIRFVFGQQYVQHEANAVLSILIWTVPILAWRRHARSAMIALNRQREELACSLLGLALLVALVIPLSYAGGAIGSAWAVILSELVGTALTWSRLRRHVPDLRLPRHLFGPPSLVILSGRRD